MNGLVSRLEDTWSQQGEVGFLLGDANTSAAETRRIPDPVSGLEFRLRWLPHREIRTDIAELERRGILNQGRNETALFRDQRDPSGRYCFLCSDNIREANPLEVLVPLTLAGREYSAGANFAWIARHHFTVMSADHRDQAFSGHVLEAMHDLHRQTKGAFRVIYNGASTGATIPWHLHYQITSEAFPVEELRREAEELYPAALQRFESNAEIGAAISAVEDWEGLDPENHEVNLLVAGAASNPVTHVIRRDARLTQAPEKGLIGGFEVCGDLVYSEPATRKAFDRATAETVRATLESIRPVGG